MPGRSSSRVLSVLVLASPGHVRFIDYEYSSYNYQAFDIGNHFNEFAGLPNLAANFFVVKKRKKKKKKSKVAAVSSHHLHVSVPLATQG